MMLMQGEMVKGQGEGGGGVRSRLKALQFLLSVGADPNAKPNELLGKRFMRVCIGTVFPDSFPQKLTQSWSGSFHIRYSKTGLGALPPIIALCGFVFTRMKDNKKERKREICVYIHKNTQTH